MSENILMMENVACKLFDQNPCFAKRLSVYHVGQREELCWHSVPWNSIYFIHQHQGMPGRDKVVNFSIIPRPSCWHLSPDSHCKRPAAQIFLVTVCQVKAVLPSGWFSPAARSDQRSQRSYQPPCSSGWTPCSRWLVSYPQSRFPGRLLGF